MSTPWLTPSEEAAWRAYIEGSQRLNARIEADLEQLAGMTGAEYQLLVLLSEAPDGRLRPGELAGQLVFSPSRLTYQLGRMERLGLIGREPCPDDRRGSYAVITQTGREALHRAAEAHVRSVRKHLLNLLDGCDVEDLGRIFSRIRAHHEGAQPAARA